MDFELIYSSVSISID